MSFVEVKKAVERISPFIHRTPVMTCSYLNHLVGRELYFKCENFQKSGSFKARGALNAVMKIKETNPSCPGVTTHSSGNHAQALAWAASMNNLPCSVIVPNNIPSVKCEAIRGYGADIVFCEPTPISRTETCQRVANEKGLSIIGTSENNDVMVGQGTLAVEFLEEVPDLDAMFISTSVGGMTAGCSLSVKAIKPSCKVFAVAPNGKGLGKCLEAGERLWTSPPKCLDTIADGMRMQAIGEVNFKIFLECVEKQVFCVSDDEIVEAMKLVWQRMKLVVETSAAAAVAAVLSEKMKTLDPSIKKVGVILCGGNTDIDNLPW